MVSASDILNALKEVKEWARLRGLPERVDALEKRLAALEAKPANPETVCPVDGMQMKWVSKRPSQHFGIFGQMDETWSCPTCGHTRVVKRKPQG